MIYPIEATISESKGSNDTKESKSDKIERLFVYAHSRILSWYCSTVDFVRKKKKTYLSQHMKKGYLLHRRPTKKVQASLRMSAVSPEPLLVAYI